VFWQGDAADARARKHSSLDGCIEMRHRGTGDSGVCADVVRALEDCHRILVIGSPGAGKTTLATKLAVHLELPLISLDEIYWSSGWTATPDELWRRKVDTLAAQERWILDGMFAETLERRLNRADAVVLVDVPPWRC